MKPDPKPKDNEAEQADDNEFARFDDLMKRLISVPKEEIDEEAKKYDKQKIPKIFKKKK